jgi:hypothetical protein
MPNLISSRALRAALLAGALLAALPASAKVYAFKHTGHETRLTMPDSWSLTPINGGIQAQTGDGEVYIWVQAMTDSNVAPLIDEYFAYYKKQGVTFTGPTTNERGVIGGVAVRLMDAPATFNGKPTIVRFTFIDPKPGATGGLLIGYWASPQGDAANDTDVTRFMSDLLQP